MMLVGDQIDVFRLRALRSALQLEILGMKRRGTSAYTILKRELGLKGSRENVLKQLTTLLYPLPK